MSDQKPIQQKITPKPVAQPNKISGTKPGSKNKIKIRKPKVKKKANIIVSIIILSLSIGIGISGISYIFPKLAGYVFLTGKIYKWQIKDTKKFRSIALDSAKGLRNYLSKTETVKVIKGIKTRDIMNISWEADTIYSGNSYRASEIIVTNLYFNSSNVNKDILRAALVNNLSASRLKEIIKMAKDYRFFLPVLVPIMKETAKQYLTGKMFP